MMFFAKECKAKGCHRRVVEYPFCWQHAHLMVNGREPDAAPVADNGVNTDDGKPQNRVRRRRTTGPHCTEVDCDKPPMQGQRLCLDHYLAAIRNDEASSPDRARASWFAIPESVRRKILADGRAPEVVVQSERDMAAKRAEAIRQDIIDRQAANGAKVADEPDPSVCVIDGCVNKVSNLGLCRTHYSKFREEGTLSDFYRVCADPMCSKQVPTLRAHYCDEHKPKGSYRRKLCEVDGCTNKARGYGRCEKHKNA